MPVSVEDAIRRPAPRPARRSLRGSALCLHFPCARKRREEATDPGSAPSVLVCWCVPADRRSGIHTDGETDSTTRALTRTSELWQDPPARIRIRSDMSYPVIIHDARNAAKPATVATRNIPTRARRFHRSSAARRRRAATSAVERRASCRKPYLDYSQERLASYGLQPFGFELHPECPQHHSCGGSIEVGGRRIRSILRQIQAARHRR